jgi:hypothetical protein
VRVAIYSETSHRQRGVIVQDRLKGNCGNWCDVIADPPTTVTLPTSVVRRLRLYKTGGKTYADVLEELMDSVPPKSFLEWAERELELAAEPYSEARSKLGIPKQ